MMTSRLTWTLKGDAMVLADYALTLTMKLTCAVLDIIAHMHCFNGTTSHSYGGSLFFPTNLQNSLINGRGIAQDVPFAVKIKTSSKYVC